MEYISINSFRTLAKTMQQYIYRQIVLAKLFIDDNYSESLNLNLVANQAFFSKYHFVRLFKSIYGYSPHQYLIKVRMEKAALMLQEGKDVLDVCLAVGFDSVTSFTAAFKRHHRISPASYKKLSLSRRKEIERAPFKFIPGCFASSLSAS